MIRPLEQQEIGVQRPVSLSLEQSIHHFAASAEGSARFEGESASEDSEGNRNFSVPGEKSRARSSRRIFVELAREASGKRGGRDNGANGARDASR